MNPRQTNQLSINVTEIIPDISGNSWELPSTAVTLQVMGHLNLTHCEPEYITKELTLLMMKEHFPKVFAREFPELCI